MDMDELTAREREIFALAASGVSNASIADELGISENAVRYHLKEIHSKLETGGHRSRLSWLRLRGAVLLGLFDARATSVAATGGVFAAVGVLAAGAYLAQPSSHVSGDAHSCPTVYSFVPGTTWEEIASIAMKSVDEVRALNPGLSDDVLTSQFNEVNVGKREGAECAEAIPTVPAGSQPIGGTPQAG